jgi:hypothetical protein
VVATETVKDGGGGDYVAGAGCRTTTAMQPEPVGGGGRRSDKATDAAGRKKNALMARVRAGRGPTYAVTPR